MIPSPASPVALQLGPLGIPWYGVGYAVALAVGVLLTIWLARRRGLEPRHVEDALLWVVVGGVIGARLYHVIDQWALYRDDLLRIVLPPYTGLALYGGVAGGLAGAWLYGRRHGQPFLRWVDTVVPALFFGQAIARFGNYFNQELYGPPTTLPWGIAIDCAHRVAAFPCPGAVGVLPGQATFGPEVGFHPLFFYEASLTFLGGLAALLLITRAPSRLRDGDLLALWLIWYGVVRSVLESFRLSYDFTFFGAPVAMLLGLGAIGAGAILLGVNHRRGGRALTPMPVRAALAPDRGAGSLPGAVPQPGGVPQPAAADTPDPTGGAGTVPPS